MVKRRERQGRRGVIEGGDSIAEALSTASAFNGAQQPGSTNLAVAVLVLLARTARTGFVAANLVLATYRRNSCRHVTLFGAALRFGQRRGVSVLELHALGHGLGFAAQTGLFFGRVFAAHLHVT